jgi:hypothetical protein
MRKHTKSKKPFISVLGWSHIQSPHYLPAEFEYKGLNRSFSCNPKFAVKISERGEIVSEIELFFLGFDSCRF